MLLLAETHVLTLEQDSLYALVSPYRLDGRVSSHPVTARGFTSMNVYLLAEAEGVLLYSTGYSIHQQGLLEALDSLVGDRALSLVIPRIEFSSMCNARPIADRFPVSAVYQRIRQHPSEFLDFRPEVAQDGYDGLRDVEAVILNIDKPIPVPAHESRNLALILPGLRLLPSYWSYDAATRTLFTGDIFSWVWYDDPSGPWLVETAGDEALARERIRSFLLRNRYWWLAGADTEPLRRWLADLFDEYQIERIAPDHGPILTGEAIAFHYRLLDELLAGVGQEPSIGVAAGQWTFASGS